MHLSCFILFFCFTCELKSNKDNLFTQLFKNPSFHSFMKLMDASEVRFLLIFNELLKLKRAFLLNVSMLNASLMLCYTFLISSNYMIFSIFD